MLHCIHTNCRFLTGFLCSQSQNINRVRFSHATHLAFFLISRYIKYTLLFLFAEHLFFSLFGGRVLFFVEMQLIPNVMLLLSIQKSDSKAEFFQILFHYQKMLSTVPCSIHQGLVVFLIYVEQCFSVNPKLLNYNTPSPPPLSPLVTVAFIFYVCVSISVLEISSLVSYFLDSTHR